MRILGRSGKPYRKDGDRTKSADEMGTKIGPRRGSSLYANAPLNILGGGAWRWPNSPHLDAETLLSSRAQHRPLRGPPWINPARLVAREQLGCRAATGLLLEIDIGKRLAALVADHKAGVQFGNGPRRREAAT
jgi:hypothetical protein